jgi:hypothetical protein
MRARTATALTAVALTGVFALTGCTPGQVEAPGTSSSAPAEPSDSPSTAELSDVSRLVGDSIASLQENGITFTPVEGGNGLAVVAYDPSRAQGKQVAMGYLDDPSNVVALPTQDDQSALQYVEFGRLQAALDAGATLESEVVAEDADFAVVITSLPDGAKFTFTVSKATGLPVQVFIQEAGSDWGVDLLIEFGITDEGKRILDAAA